MKTRILRAARRALVSSRERNDVRGASLLAAVVLGVGLVTVLGPAPSDAQEYSAYSDPGKTALSFVLSREENVEEFRQAFGLNGGEVRELLSALRKENEALAEEYAESERLIGVNKELSDDRIAQKIDASDYDEKVRAAISATKRAAESVVPEDQRSDLEAWVDGQWRREVQEAQEPQMVQSRQLSSRATRGVTCRVFATQYIGYTRYEVALPHRRIKFDGGYRVGIQRTNGSHPTTAPVKEVGPWNTYGNYWDNRRYRTMWKDLQRCVPEARAAYYNNYNRGEDEYGREVLNPAGIDLTPAVARSLGLRKYQNAWVRVRYPWAR